MQCSTLLHPYEDVAAGSDKQGAHKTYGLRYQTTKLNGEDGSRVSEMMSRSFDHLLTSRHRVQERLTARDTCGRSVHTDR